MGHDDPCDRHFAFLPVTGRQAVSGLPDHHAAVLGINAYSHGVAPLKSAVADARAVAEALATEHGYRAPLLRLDGDATRAGTLRLLEQELPARLGPDSALVLYFAGHGVALGDGREGPQGYLLPQDAHRADESTWLSMDRVRRALGALPCRHLLVVLDCCFAGSFRWAASRNVVPVGRPLYDSQYNRYLAGTAWQVLTSAAHDEKALDVVPGARNHRDAARSAGHSPFAGALLRGLAGKADSSRGSHHPDGVITATELFQYVFEELVPPESESHQTPGLWPLKPENTGEFIFLSPRQEKNTRPDPPLDDANNPWPGLAAYSENDAALFFGRRRVIEEILRRLRKGSPLVTVVGASGTGKSSVVKAGVLPRLAGVVHVPRLEGDPRRLLAEAEGRLAELSETSPMLFVDQFEELYTQCPDNTARDGFLERLCQLMTGGAPVRVLVTLRSDFEPRLASSALGRLLAGGRYLMPALTSKEIREVVEKPAAAKALYFEPTSLVDDLVDEVLAIPGPLPLLSFALAEMYRQSNRRRRNTGDLDRALTGRDYETVGGVVGALHRRATTLYDDAEDDARRATVRRVALRMVAFEGGRVTRRRISERELEQAEPEEQERVDRAVRRLTETRLVVADEGYLEPAHDTLVQAWPRLGDWLAESAGVQPLMRAVWRSAVAWEDSGEDAGMLWHQDPRLPQAMAHRAELNRLERRFVDAGTRRKRRRQSVLTAVTAAVILVLGMLSVVAWQRATAETEARRQADRQRQRAEDTLRVAVASEWLSEDPARVSPSPRAALVLLEVSEPAATPYAMSRMLEAMSRSPQHRAFKGHEDNVSSVTFNAEGTRLLTASWDGTARLWIPGTRNDPTSALPVVFRGHQGKLHGAVFSPAGTRILTYADDGTARLWHTDHPSGRPVVLRGPERKMTGAVFNGDGTRILTLSEDQTVRLWDVSGPPDRTVDQPVVLAKPAGAVAGVAFHADHPRIVTLSYREGAVRVTRFDPHGQGAGQPIVLPIKNGEPPRAAAFNVEGTRLLAFSRATVWIWSLGGPQGLRVSEPILRQQDEPVIRASLNAGGTRLVTISLGEVRIWDLTVPPGFAGGEPMVLRRYLWSAGFNSDGTWLATGEPGGIVRLWPLRVEELRQALRAGTSACLEPALRRRSLGEPRDQAWQTWAECEKRHGRKVPSPL